MHRNSCNAASLTLATLVMLAGCGDSGATSTTASTGDDGTGDPQTTNASTPPTSDGPTTNPPTTDGPTTDQPTTDGPTTDGPTTDEPGTGSTTGSGTTSEPETTTAPGTDTGHTDTGVLSTGEDPPTCEDGIANQAETDVDCGGPNCGPCPDGAVCSQDEDCQIASCINSVCAAPSCEDGEQNAQETDIDCGGGECQTCDDALKCAVAADCDSQVCTEGICAAPACDDAVANGEETDVDCGGPTCDGCLGDATCIDDSDCLSGTCTAGVCDPVECLVDSDCDALDSACTTGSCKKPGYTCVALPANEGQPCEDADLCNVNTICGAGVCGGGGPLDCSALSDSCNLGKCNPDTGACVAQSLVFTEDFSDNTAGWMLGSEWEIAPAKASVGCSGGNDPALDHTATDDNGVAGVVVGGCIINKQIHDYYCLTSPVIDLSVVPAAVNMSYWRWLVSDYTPYMKNQLQVFDGNNWVTLFETAGSSTADAAWKSFNYDVTPYKNPKFQARWCFNVGNTGVFSSPSWSVDDVKVSPVACMQ